MLTRRYFKNIALFRESYDQICPIGEWCGTALWMRRQGLRNASLPMDWIGLGDIVGFVDVICGDFKGFLRKENLHLIEAGKDQTFGMMVYEDVATKARLYHDFPVGIEFEKAFPVVQRRYLRRIARLYECVNAAKRTLFIHYARQKATDAGTVLECARRLREKFPGKNPNLLVIENMSEPCEEVAEELAPGVVRIRGNFFREGDDSRYGNLRMGREIFSAIQFKGRWLQLFCRRIERVRFLLFTCCHLTHNGRDMARKQLRMRAFYGNDQRP